MPSVRHVHRPSVALRAAARALKERGVAILFGRVVDNVERRRGR
jgi:hypothetical protein